ncbi:NAD-dependent protein deacylase [Deferribacter autotrophicus]|uniref:NAD-dependent protein deacetylase n=1 Tax=Deferribacter autotrophicus TaxID=500465 RepID=A0A5A8F7A6_9BACT|nr:NAD-dependent protein deacylase [Deferribacter autotrophicus]KAA0258868.1 NAD-dependent protein deacylase [Deferribacter autotrophicus]
MNEINKLAEKIKNSKNIVVFTGAGISTESGIPDFRSPKTGLWNKYSDLDFITIDGFKRNPDKFYDFALETFDIIFKANPNDAHYFIANLEKKGKVKAVITQNIDGLHQKAGSKNVLQLHGDLTKSICLSCNVQFSTRRMFEIAKKLKAAPKCPQCGGIIKPNVVFFGESLPADILEESITYSKNCDLFIVMGSSLVVMPAALLPGYAKEAGATVVILNKTPTPYDSLADIVINDTLSKIVKELEEVMDG